MNEITQLFHQAMDWARGQSTQYLGTTWGPPAVDTAHAVLTIALVLGPLLGVVLYYQLVERWVIGWIQVRKGPNRVGFKGMLQPIADAIKLLMKEQIVPAGASKALFFLAPIVSVGPALAAWSIIPFMPGWVVSAMVSSAMASVCKFGVVLRKSGLNASRAGRTLAWKTFR